MQIFETKKADKCDFLANYPHFASKNPPCSSAEKLFEEVVAESGFKRFDGRFEGIVTLTSCGIHVSAAVEDLVRIDVDGSVAL